MEQCLYCSRFSVARNIDVCMNTRITLYRVGLLGWLLCCPGLVLAQDYPTHEAQQRSLQQLAAAHGATAELTTLGTSAGGRAIHVLEIGTGDRANKPALLVIAGAEVDDLTGPVAAEAFARYLLESTADSVTTLLNRATVYVIPRLSPDPLAHAAAAVRDRVHGNDAPDDADRDGLTDEDGPNDLDGNGWISWMRVEDANGTYLAHEDESLLLRPADTGKGEVGRYLMIKEGRDDDEDLEVNEDAAGGVHVNRNTSHAYAPFQVDSGEHPFVAPELQALGDFVFAHPNILAIYTFSEHDNLHQSWKIRHPAQRNRPNQFSADSSAYSASAERLADFAVYHGTGAVPAGSIPGWAYYHAGRISYSAPAFTYPDSVAKSIKTSMDRHHRAIHWLRANRPDLVLDWTVLEHPDYPGQTVELGGVDPFALNNPMADDLLAEATTNATTLLYQIAHELPRLRIDEPKVENLGRNVYQVTVTVHNDGDLPTHTVAGRRVYALRPLRADLTLANGQTLVAGREITLMTDPIPGGGRAQLTYTIIGRGSVDITVGSPSAGNASVRTNLN